VCGPALCLATARITRVSQVHAARIGRQIVNGTDVAGAEPLLATSRGRPERERRAVPPIERGVPVPQASREMTVPRVGTDSNQQPTDLDRRRADTRLTQELKVRARARLAAVEGDHEGARVFYAEALEQYARLGNPHAIRECHEAVAGLANR
jgi:Mg-chelatase subunit ChlI